METLNPFKMDVTYTQGKPPKLDNDVQFHHDVIRLHHKLNLSVEEISVHLHPHSERSIAEAIILERGWNDCVGILEKNL